MSVLCWCDDALNPVSSLDWKYFVDIHYTLPGNVITISIFHPIPSKNESKTKEQVGTSFLRNCYEGGALQPHPHPFIYCLM